MPLAAQKSRLASLRHKTERKIHMKKNLTELVFILDRSGSMRGLESDTIGGFNSMIEKQKQQPGEAVVSTVLFDHETQVLYDRVQLQNVPPMSEKEYYVRGMTALFDAVGGAIAHIGHVHRLLGEDNVPEHTMFIITTDGMENASREYTAGALKTMIEEQKAKNGWEFLFLGANIDAVRAAGQIGISAERAVNYHADSAGTRLNYETVSACIADVRENKGVRAGWKAKIEQDFKARKKP